MYNAHHLINGYGVHMDNQIIANMPFEEYLRQPAISCSQLKHLACCPKAFKYFVIDANEQEDTEAMQLGRALHTLVLEPNLFAKEYVILPKVKGKGPAYKAKQQLELGSKVLWDTEHDVLVEMRKAIEAHQYAGRFLEGTKNEASIFWKSELETSGIDCRGRIDAIKNNGSDIVLVDIKSTVDASESAFTRQIFQLKYYMQAAYYLDGYEAITQTRPNFFVFIAIEKKPPYLCAVYLLSADSDAIIYGRQEYIRLLSKYKTCLDSDNWSEGYDNPCNVLLPPWLQIGE